MYLHRLVTSGRSCFFLARIEAVLAEVCCGYSPALKPAENFGAGIDFLMITGVSNDAAPDKPVWLVGLSFARDTRRFVEGVVQRGW